MSRILKVTHLVFLLKLIRRKLSANTEHVRSGWFSNTNGEKVLICLVSKLLTVYDVCHYKGPPPQKTQSSTTVWGGGHRKPPCRLNKERGGDLVAVYVVDKIPLHVAIDISTPVNTSSKKKKYLIVYIFFEWLSISKWGLLWNKYFSLV